MAGASSLVRSKSSLPSFSWRRASVESLESLFYDLKPDGTTSPGAHPPQRTHQWRVQPSLAEFVGARRSKHTIVAWGDAIFVFGGDDGKRMLADLLRYDLKDNSWGRVILKHQHQAPSPRYHHSAVVYGDSMFVFGGYTGDLNSQAVLRNLNDLFEFRFQSCQWIEWGSPSGAGSSAGTRRPQVTLPPGRSAHGAAVYDNKMWIFAGYDGNKRLNDMWCVPLSLGDGDETVPHWHEVEQSGDHPPTCCNFPVAVLRDSMFVFSGQSGFHITNHLFQFRFAERCWIRVLTQQVLPGTCPPPARRYGHTMVARGNELYVFGGYTGDTLSHHLHCFNLDSRAWSVIEPAAGSEAPIGRVFHAAEVVGDQMYIFGGTGADNARHADMFCFQFDTLPRCRLRDDFANLLDAELLVDIYLVAGGERIGAHSSIVAARSPELRSRILAAHQKANQSKSTKGWVPAPVVDIDLSSYKPNVVRVALMFMYTDRVFPDSRSLGRLLISEMHLLMDVYKLARELRLALLVHMCTSLIEASVDHNTVLEALQSAHERQLASIKEYCLRFVTRDSNYRDIVMSKPFESLDRSLMVEIIRRHQSSTVSPRASSPDMTTGVGDLNEVLFDASSCTLSFDMREWLGGQGQPFYDFSLTLDGEAIPAHRAILAARCSYFEAMFRSFPPTEDKVAVKIGEIIPTCDAFNSLLKYIYYGETNMPPEHALYLFAATHFYGFSNGRLQSHCRRCLETNIKASNVVAVLEAADKIQAADMKRHALTIIARNFTKVVDLPAVRSLSRELLLDVLDAVSEHLGKYPAWFASIPSLEGAG